MVFSRPRDPHRRVAELEQTVEALQQELKLLRAELADRVSKSEIEAFVARNQQKIEETLRSAERLELTKKDFQQMVENLSELHKKVQYIDPSIREVFLALSERVRRAEHLVRRLDGKMEKRSTIGVPPAEDFGQ